MELKKALFIPFLIILQLHCARGSLVNAELEREELWGEMFSWLISRTTTLSAGIYVYDDQADSNTAAFQIADGSVYDVSITSGTLTLDRIDFGVNAVPVLIEVNAHITGGAASGIQTLNINADIPGFLNANTTIATGAAFYGSAGVLQNVPPGNIVSVTVHITDLALTGTVSGAPFVYHSGVTDAVLGIPCTLAVGLDPYQIDITFKISDIFKEPGLLTAIAGGVSQIDAVNNTSWQTALNSRIDGAMGVYQCAP